MQRRLVFVGALLSLLLLVASVAAAAPSITVWIGGHVVEQEKTWAEIVRNFEKETGIKVNYQLIGFDVYYDKLVTAFTAGEGPDVTFADLGGWVPTFASKGWLEPLDAYLAKSSVTSQIWPNIWGTVEYKGVRYGLPWYTDDRVLLYNTRMFKEAGLDPSKPPQTWNDLISYAKKLTNPQKRTYGYGVSGKKSEVTTLGYMMFLLSNGGQVLTPDYARAAFNSPAGVEALKVYTDLYTVHQVSPPGTLSYGEDDYRTMMAQNRVAMAIGGPWSFPLIEMANPAIKGNYMAAVHPYGKQPASVLGGWASVISKTSKNKDASWKFIEYVTSYEVWREWLRRHGGPMPTRQDVAKDAPELKDPKWRVILDIFPKAGFRPPIPEWPEVSDRIQTMVQNVLAGKMTPQEAANWAEREIDSILNR
ncbi:MAG: sugar ABC transporter substrate-binding protein [Limnochordaceae bacterium]|uniref:Sugar ABC transporter substrate-binding protein n=1 Tax=Carboxydichorda subterranea TaxID=3109565 RepID=A0ABZ1C0X4_9FIRM|nr:sugar ABC transporter substrate-binding protein [Limnochorda sp. L945t]MBE3597610.1 sugar ABC transporter substrate-binding protein [Limnochordaceae bacterium]WRP18677.1 sugar ABC transporter substrate-binding protein [Limnochorda sp. L945t]